MLLTLSPAHDYSPGLVSHGAPNGLSLLLCQCMRAGSQKPAVAWALSSVPMAVSSYLCSGAARGRGGMVGRNSAVRAIAMETPPTLQAPEEGRARAACSTVCSEKWLVIRAPLMGKTGHFTGSVGTNPSGSLCT